MHEGFVKRALDGDSESDSKTLYFPEIEGFGTTYEAYVTSRILSRFVKENRIKSVCEYPVCTFRVPGAVGVPLAIKGCDVTLASTSEATLRRANSLCKSYSVQDKVRLAQIGTDQLESNSFDLVFHISLLPTMRRELGINPFSCLRDMVRLSKKHIIVANHNLHYSVPLDKILSLATRTCRQFGEISLVGANPVKRMLHSLGASIIDEFFFDIPPWMAVDLSKIFSNIRVFSTHSIAASDSSRIDNIMRNYSFIERLSIPRLVKRFFAHHVAIIAEKYS